MNSRYRNYVTGSALAAAFFWLSILFLPLLNGCSSEPEATFIPTVGILLFGDSRQAQVDGFVDEMVQAGFVDGKSIHYVFRNAKNERKKLASMLNELTALSPALLVAAGGLEADTMKKSAVVQQTPVVVLYVNAIVERGLVKSRNQSGWKVTGVDNLNAEISGKRVELIKDMLPDTRRILILYYEKIAPSRIGVAEARLVAQKLGIEIEARKVTSRDDIRSVMASIAPGEFDAMLTVPTAPIDNALKEIILPQVKRLNLPLFTHSRSLAELGAFASYGADFYELGQQCARLAQKVLVGIDPQSIPFEIPKRFIYSVNKEVQHSLGLQMTEIAQQQVNETLVTVN